MTERSGGHLLITGTYIKVYTTLENSEGTFSVLPFYQLNILWEVTVIRCTMGISTTVYILNTKTIGKTYPARNRVQFTL